MQAHGLPQRWRGRHRFVLLQTGFGNGQHLLATWAAWRADPKRPAHLHYLLLAPQTFSRAEAARALNLPAPNAPPDASRLGRDHLALAQALLAAWPPATPDLHPIALEGGRVQLLLGFGAVAQWLPELVAQVDVFWLHPSGPQPQGFQGLQRLAAPDATASVMGSGQDAIHQALMRAGFVAGDAPPPGHCQSPAAVRSAPARCAPAHAAPARFAPRHLPPPPPGRQGQAGARTVVVIGAGLAGAAAARALAAQGLQVQVLEALPGPAQATSGNPGGLLHGIVHAQDGPHARWLRAAALHAQRVLAPGVASGALPGCLQGLLRGEATLSAAAMQALLDDQGLPADYVQVRTQPGSGTPAGWLYPGAGWVSPAALVRHWLGGAGITLHTHCTAHGLQRQGDHWQVLGDNGQPLAEAHAIVLANAHDTQRLLAAQGLPPWPTGRQRGQTTVLPAGLPGAPRLPFPLATGGYALQLPDGRLLCGATSQAGDDDPALRTADHADNLAKLARITGWVAPLAADDPRLDGRVGWRFVTDDRLPLIGPVPVPQPTGPRLQQPRQVPRIPGLWLLSALGSRGLTQAALAGELLAAWMTDAPWPVPASLVDALDPARFAARAARRGAQGAQPEPGGKQRGDTQRGMLQDADPGRRPPGSGQS